MKKIIFYLLLLTLVLNPGFVRAESDENVTERRREKAAEIQEIRQERKEEREERRQEIKENLETKRVELATKHAERLDKRFSVYYTRLSNIITRFNERLAFLKKEGKDVSALETKLATIKTSLEAAKTKGDSAVTAFKSISSTDAATQKTELEAAKKLAQDTRTLYQGVHESLKEALKSLKTISKPALPAASAAVNNSL